MSVITEKFVSAARLMAGVLGAESHEFVTIPHPISSATAAALEEAAVVAVDRCVELLSGAHTG